MRDAGVELRDFDSDSRAKIDELNTAFADHFVTGVGPRGGAKFDYLLNEGKFEIQFSSDDPRTIVTKWIGRGGNSIYAYAIRPVRVALARFAREFSEIDDPRAFDFNYTVGVEVGEIAVFISEEAPSSRRSLKLKAVPATVPSERPSRSSLRSAHPRQVMSNNTLQRTHGHRGRPVLAKGLRARRCAIGGRGRPLSEALDITSVRHREFEQR